jgi:hypothetical protein
MQESGNQAQALRHRAAQWRAFAAWEAAHEAARDRSISADLAWLWGAIQLAQKLAPESDPIAAAHARASHRILIRAALAPLDRVGQ